jgi:hypothetical protein
LTRKRLRSALAGVSLIGDSGRADLDRARRSRRWEEMHPARGPGPLAVADGDRPRWKCLVGWRDAVVLYAE